MVSTNRKAKALHGLAALFVAAALSVCGLAGCSSANDGAVVVPDDHYALAGQTIDFEHSRCVSCHAELAENFTVGGGELLVAHQEALAAYDAGGADLDDDAKQIIADNYSTMKGQFGTDYRGTNCVACHASAIAEDGSIVTEDFFSIDDCGQCHDYEDAIEATEEWDDIEGLNLHDSHLGQIECENCHQMHGATEVLMCNECHYYSLPEDGLQWENPESRYR